MEALKFLLNTSQIKRNYIFNNETLKEGEVFVLYSNIGSNNNKRLKFWNYYMSFLPDELKKEVLKYKFAEDQNNCLIGKLMTLIGYFIFTGKDLKISDLLKSKFGKPYVNGKKIHFNISHSGSGVMCCFSKNSIGIDIEEIKRVDVNLFRSVFTDIEFLDIKENGIERFYHYWTAKESVTKEEGYGLTMDLKSLRITSLNAEIKDRLWWLKGKKIDRFYFTLASQNKIEDVKIMQIQFS